MFFLTGISSCKKSYVLQSLPLKGKWELCLDSVNVPKVQLNFNLKIDLPGTLDEAGIGKETNMQPAMVREVMLHLQRKHKYIGKAWYRKTIEVPQNLNNKEAILKLERVIWKSIVYVDGKLVGSSNSLSVPHYYNLSDFLTPGKHQLVICIDNSKQFDLNNNDMAHAYTNETQIMWNGILGDFQIDFYPADNGLKNIQVFPNEQWVVAKIEGKFNTKSRLQLAIKRNSDNREVARKLFQPTSDGIYKLDLDKEIKIWNEFSPNLYQLETSLIQDGEIIGTMITDFGFRTIGVRGNRLILNGDALFLRGTLECSIFPLTGHPPLENTEWLKIFRKAKSYGLNHLRFHSWCPPEAAFSAADQLGFYLQVELPNWNTAYGKDTASTNFVEMEASRIIAEYGNHPSFCFMSMGNELQGDFNRLNGLVKNLKNQDKRHLYTTTTFTFEQGHGKYPEPVDDYFITQYTDSGWVRGQGVFDSEYPNFNTDYTNVVKHLPVPLITHEIGQYSVFPNLNEIEKYTGVLNPLNFKAIKKDLQQKGLLHLAEEYLMASGKLAALLYKEEIERTLKTEGISGFQLLDLHDFPGQGTALVGLLDVFWDSKGIIDSTEFKRFCSDVVPLIWIDKAVYKNTEQLSVNMGVANYSMPMKNKTLTIKLIDDQKKVLNQKKIPVANIPLGKTSKLGQFKFSLIDINEARQLTIELSIEGTRYQNSWPIWVYPEISSENQANEIFTTQSFAEAEKALKEGRKVFLNPELESLNGLEGKFVQVFWSPVHFPDQPGTMGLLMDPNHPVFKLFPTESHSNWQWWDLCKQSKTLDFGELPIKPLVRVIDNFFKNRNLTNLFEAKVLNGKLVFSSINLTDKLCNRLEASMLRRSIINYMKSETFSPDGELDFRVLKRSFHAVERVSPK